MFVSLWSHLVHSRSNHVLTRSRTQSAWLSAVGALSVWLLATSSAFAAPPNTMSIWRVQVRFITADVDDAGSDSSVWIKLNDNNKTYIDSGRDDRERGHDETYELRLDGVHSLADLDYFRIEKDGDDGWAIRRMMLIVNNVAIYDESFSSSPLWLDNEGGAARIRFIDDQFMRPRSQWASYVVPARPSIVPVGDMNARVESLHGDFTTPTSNLSLRETGHGDASLNAININTWQVHVDLTEKNILLIGQDINVDFKMQVGCTGGNPTFTVSSVNASSSFEPYTTDTRAQARDFVNGDFKVRLNDMMKGFHYAILCPTIALAPNGDLHLSSRFNIGDYVVSNFQNTAALALMVDTGDGIKTFTPANYTATVASRLKTDTKAQLSFELPAAIAAYDALVEVRPLGASEPNDVKTTVIASRSALSKSDSRTIKADLKQRADDTSLLTFTDVLGAGQVAQYTLHLVYQPKDEGKGSITTVIQPLDPETQKLITPLKSVTDFSFSKGAVFPEGTSTTASHNVGDKPVWKDPKPADAR